MEEAVAFIHNFIEKEYAALRAAALERDEEVYKTQRRVVNRMYAGDLITELPLRLGDQDEWFAKAARYLENKKPRTLFQIKAYAHHSYQRVYCCYVSDFMNVSTSYFQNLCVAQAAVGLRIIAAYLVTFDRKGWKYSGGQRIEPLGDLIEVRQFQPPENPVDRAEYDASAPAAAIYSNPT